MRIEIKLLGLLVTLVTLGSFLYAQIKDGGPEGIPPEKKDSIPPVDSDYVFVPLGQHSCSASACHGNPNASSLTSPPDKNCWQSSLTHFLAVDPHRKAYDVLLSEKSKHITASLRKGSSVSIPDAHEDVRCLACHTNPMLPFSGAVDEKWKQFRKEGVSCEACHGNADQWRASHTAWTTDTRLRTPAGLYSSLRTHPTPIMPDLNDPRIRLKTCLGCHVGDSGNSTRPPRDMNHDMIAAGHPELKFDYDSLMARYPKHWLERERAEKPRDKPDNNLEVQKWKEKLSTDRKKRQDDGRTPWPELSETKCTDCHRKIPS